MSVPLSLSLCTCTSCSWFPHLIGLSYRVASHRVVHCSVTSTYPSSVRAMVTESDQINRADYIPRLQYQARDTPVSETISALDLAYAHKF